MFRVGMIGDKESVLGFKAVGFDVKMPSGYEDAKKALDEFCSKNYAIIFITEEFTQLLKQEIDAFKDLPIPAIIVLPNNQGSNGMGIAAVKKSVERAVGADILG